MKLPRRSKKKISRKKLKAGAIVHSPSVARLEDGPKRVGKDVLEYIVPQYVFSNAFGDLSASFCMPLSVFNPNSPESQDFIWNQVKLAAAISVAGKLVPLIFESDVSPQTSEIPSDDTTVIPCHGNRLNLGLLGNGSLSITSDDVRNRDNYPSDAVYNYVQEQLKLNKVRTGRNLVSPERTEHILRGDPTTKTIVCPTETGLTVKTVPDWSGGHSNPQAAQQYKKTQKPFFWTDERFMYEISDILISPDTNWTPQGDDSRYICIEERSGVPIKLVAEIPTDGEITCVTAFPAAPSIRIEK